MVYFLDDPNNMETSQKENNSQKSCTSCTSQEKLVQFNFKLQLNNKL
jgi:hypothetical protein